MYTTFLNEIVEKLHQGTDDHIQETSMKNPPFFRRLCWLWWRLSVAVSLAEVRGVVHLCQVYMYQLVYLYNPFIWTCSTGKFDILFYYLFLFVISDEMQLLLLKIPLLTIKAIEKSLPLLIDKGDSLSIKKNILIFE